MRVAKKIPVIPFTQEGYEKLKKEKAELLVKRVDAVNHLKKAREMGDLSENGYYKASRFKLTSIDRRLNELTYLIRYAKIIEVSRVDAIELGCKVTLSDGKNERTYVLVGAYEADPSKGNISNVSPIGKLLLGKKAGESIMVDTPSGQVTYTIVTIERGSI